MKKKWKEKDKRNDQWNTDQIVVQAEHHKLYGDPKITDRRSKRTRAETRNEEELRGKEREGRMTSDEGPMKTEKK